MEEIGLVALVLTARTLRPWTAAGNEPGLAAGFPYLISSRLDFLRIQDLRHHTTVRDPREY